MPFRFLLTRYCCSPLSPSVQPIPRGFATTVSVLVSPCGAVFIPVTKSLGGPTPAEDPSGNPPAQVTRRGRSLQVVQGAPHRLDHGLGHVRVDLGGTSALVVTGTVTGEEPSVGGIGFPVDAHRLDGASSEGGVAVLAALAPADRPKPFFPTSPPIQPVGPKIRLSFRDS
jgi:hypothetical protein